MAARAGVAARLSGSLRRLDTPARIPGIDLARGLAVLGMFAAHLAVFAEFDWGTPSTWFDLVNGRSSILFALIGGVSISLLTGGAAGPTREGRNWARVGIVLRGLVLWGIGLVLVALGSGVYVILPAYGVLFLIAAACITWRPRQLAIAALAILVVVPLLLEPLGRVLEAGVPEPVQTVAVVALGLMYPFPLWLGFLLAGMAIGRLELATPVVHWALLGVGAVVAVVGYGFGAVPVESAWWGHVLSTAPHSGGMGEALGSTGFAIGVLGCCLLIGRTPVRHALLPLRAVGSMPLTVYVAQVAALAIAYGGFLPGRPDVDPWVQLEPFWWFALVALVAATAWALLIGRGPLEWAMSWLPGRSADPPRPDLAPRSPDRLAQ